MFDCFGLELRFTGQSTGSSKGVEGFRGHLPFSEGTDRLDSDFGLNGVLPIKGETAFPVAVLGDDAAGSCGGRPNLIPVMSIRAVQDGCGQVVPIAGVDGAALAANVHVAALVELGLAEAVNSCEFIKFHGPGVYQKRVSGKTLDGLEVVEPSRRTYQERGPGFDLLIPAFARISGS